jgi:DNA polymerase-3 subunit alpha
MRRAMGKKNKDEMAKLKVEFIEGAVVQGTQRKLAGEIFDLIEKFASYGFNKSHSVAYSVIAYQTAFLKAHYPAEYMAATLSSEIGNTDKIVLLIDDCRKMNINVLPPDVNESGKNFRVVNGDIRFGLCAIKGVGESAIDSVIATREEKGKFENLFDFCRRVDLRLVNKKCLEGLVQAGAFDSMGGHRAQYFENIERAANFGSASQEEDHSGQSNLFDLGETKRGQAISFPILPPIAQWSEHEKLMREKNVLGFYVSGHPLLKYEQEVNEFANVKFGDLSTFKSGNTTRACGIVTSVKKKIDKRGNMMAFVTIEDFSGRAECIVFSDPFAKFQQHIQQDSMVMVTGKGELNGDALKIVVNEVFPMERVREKFTKSIILSFNLNDIKENTIVELRQLLERNKGDCACFFDIVDSSKRKKYQTRKFSVDPSDEFIQDAKRILGPQGIKLAG